MSYSGKVREELLNRISSARHCRIAELAGFFSFFGSVAGDGAGEAAVRTDRDGVIKKYFTLLKKTINIVNRDIYVASDSVIIRGETAEDFIRMIKADGRDDGTVDRLILMQPCCRRAYMRAAFLSAGSITDPEKGYHFEIVTKSSAQAKLICDVMRSFDLSPKTVARQGRNVVYLKDADDISDMLKIMEAPVTMMAFENVRVEKDMKNAVNRKVNCETANIGKMVDAAVREVRDIMLIKDAGIMGSLPEKLRETAAVRLAHPDMPLKELGKLLDPPVGKSGVNHRLRRIREIADGIRKEEERDLWKKKS